MGTDRTAAQKSRLKSAEAVKVVTGSTSTQLCLSCHKLYTTSLSPLLSLSQSSRSDSLARLSGDCWCRQPSTAEPQPRVAPLRWGLARRRVCGYSLIGLPGLHATDSSPKLVSRVQTGHMWVSTHFMPPHHPPSSPSTHLLAALCPADPGSSLPRSVGGHRRSGPVGLDVRLGGQDWDTQEAWTVHTRPRVDQTGPTRRAGELKPAQPVARWRRRRLCHSLEVCSCKLMAPRFSILSLLDQVSPHQGSVQEVEREAQSVFCSIRTLRTGRPT